MMLEDQATINTDDLIAELAALNERLARIYDTAMSAGDKELSLTYGRNFDRLYAKRRNMLVRLRDAINDEIGAEQ